MNPKSSVCASVILTLAALFLFLFCGCNNTSDAGVYVSGDASNETLSKDAAKTSSEAAFPLGLLPGRPALPESGQNDTVLCKNGEPLTRDSEGNYYLTVPDGVTDTQTLGVYITLSAQDAALYADLPSDISELMSTGTPLEITALADGELSVCRLIFTTMPVMQLSVECGVSDISDGDVYGDMLLFSSDKAVASSLKMHLRGGSSRNFEKVGYKLTLLDGTGEKSKLNLLGMRRDDDWILLPMYAEESKLRDKLAWDLWGLTGAKNNGFNFYAGAKMEYVELIINGEHRGLYGLVTPVDGKQTDISDGEALFKTGDWSVPESKQLSDAAGNAELYGIEAVAPDTSQQTWEHMRKLIELVYESDDETFIQQAPEFFDIGSVCDYYIFINTAAACDNTWKNTFFTFKNTENGCRAYLIPWDCDLSFGVNWNAGERLLWEHEPSFTEALFTSELFERTFELLPSARKLLCEKWAALRNGIYADGEPERRVSELEGFLNASGALIRETARWPDGGYSSGAADYLRSFVTARINYLDYMFSLYDN